MNKNYKTYYLAIAIIVVFVTLGIFYILINTLFKSSNFNNAQNEVVITYADNISSAHLNLINKFNKLHKGKIKIEPINLPFSKFSTNERKELLARSLRSKSKKLDIFAVDLIWSARFAKWAEPLDKFITPNDTAKLLNQSLESCIFKNHLVALPMYIDVGIMYYRKDLLKQIPNYLDVEEKIKSGISWEDFIGLRKYFILDKNQFYIFPADNYEGLVCSYIEILYNYSSHKIVNETFDIKSEENKNSFKLIYDVFHNFNISPISVSEFNENDCYDYFIENDAIFLRGWPSSERDFISLAKWENIDSKVGKAPIPHLNGNNPFSVLGGWNIMISKYSEHKNEAFQFIKFILEENSQKEMYEIGSYLPVLSSLYSDKNFLQEYPDLKKNKELLDKGVHRPFLEDYTKLSDVISFYVNKVIKKEITIEDALEKADETIKTGRIIIR
ncbi:MAG: extracellular solute-binding protein [Ignavibacteriae bacterium]|nr:extracellular solute-binding protein [Ignavibacteriota bacterium]